MDTTQESRVMEPRFIHAADKTTRDRYGVVQTTLCGKNIAGFDYVQDWPEHATCPDCLLKLTPDKQSGGVIDPASV